MVLVTVVDDSISCWAIGADLLTGSPNGVKSIGVMSGSMTGVDSIFTSLDILLLLVVAVVVVLGVSESFLCLKQEI